MKIIYKERSCRTPFVFRANVGGKFYIGKSNKISGVAETLMKLYRKRLWGRPDGSNLYDPIMEYAMKKGIDTIELVIIFESSNGYEVIKRELNELVKHYGGRLCLNKNRLPHIPKPKIEGKTGRSGHWLTPNELMNAHKLLNKQVKC